MKKEIATIVETMNYAELNDLYKEIGSLKKAKLAESKIADKEAKEAVNAELNEVGKAYWNTLPAGTHFQYRDSKGNILEAIKTEKQTGNRANCELVECSTKTPKRNPEFRQIVIPNAAEAVA